MALEDFVTFQCPYCMAQIETTVDCSVKNQKYVEDCSVCCRPIVLIVSLDEEGFPFVDARQENE